MAPSSQSQIHHSTEKPRTNSSSSYNPRCGSSKAQICLQKILHTILTIPIPIPAIPNQPSSSTSSSSSSLKPSENDIKDHVPPPKMEVPQSPPATAANVQEKIQVVNEEIVDGDKKGGEEDYMGLLIDAAKLIFGEIKEDEKQRVDVFNDESSDKQLVNINKRRNKRWTVDLYEDKTEPEPEPVVRSKRGRTQVLPCKYRDSVLEPLTRVSRNRSSVISNKRRLR